jgi:hypothetical protein
MREAIDPREWAGRVIRYEQVLTDAAIWVVRGRDCVLQYESRAEQLSAGLRHRDNYARPCR